MSKSPRIIIIAISCRPYVQMAKNAGYDVVAIDAFADEDLKLAADDVYQIPVKDGFFSTSALLEVLDTFALDDVAGICYGAGFEAKPENIQMLAHYCPIVGNSAATVAACKNIEQFTQFCEQHHFCYPEVTKRKPEDVQSWLVKTANSSGGAHVQYASQTSELANHQYYQQYQSGTPVSCLFLSNGHDVTIVGINEQWCAATDESPFRYGGAMSHFSVSRAIYQQMEIIVQAATAHFHLRGLNSFDAILENEQLYLLEINPRLSATASFYDTNDFQLFQHHIQASQQGLLPEKNNQSVRAIIKAHQVKYAQYDCSIIDGHQWPEWVSDRPSPRQSILSNMPILTVNAIAESASQAKQLVEARAASMF